MNIHPPENVLHTNLKRKRPIQRICCIGGGYVGGPSAAVIADKLPHLQVTVVDVDEKRVAAWNSDQLPVYEPGLQDIVKRARDGVPHEQRESNLSFTTDVDNAIRQAQLVFVGVNTPTKTRGLGAGKASDLGWLELATRRIACSATHDTIVVEKSTVPCGTADSMRQILQANARSGVHFEVLSNPEFLAEGTAISNLLRPDRILIGCAQTTAGYAAASELADIYASWVPRDRIITMNLWSSELSKLAANAMLAQRISSINTLSSICEAVSANIQDVSHACGLDSRIGPKMLNASVGFGGSCFRKDLVNLVYISECLGLTEVAAYWESVLKVNEYQKTRFTRRIFEALHGTLFCKKLAIMGFAYKKDTGDTRESAAITIVNNLLAENATVAIYDPKVRREQILQDCDPGNDNKLDRLQICDDPYDACHNAHAVLILTEWDMFSNKRSMKSTLQPEHTQFQRETMAYDSLEPTSPNDTAADSDSDSSCNRSDTSDACHSSSSDSLMAYPHKSAPKTSVKTISKTVGDGGKKEEQQLDWARIAGLMQRPMFVFDGRNIMDVKALQQLGFRVEAIGVSSSSLTPSSSLARDACDPKWVSL